MIITKEWIDAVRPEHGHTSCSDVDLGNAYGGWTRRYDPETGKKEVIYPRCYRCYLLSNIGKDTSELEFEVAVCVSLHYKNY